MPGQQKLRSTDLQACDQAYQFLRKWLLDYPEFVSNPVYVGGDSYSGFTVPILTQLISNGNEVGIEPHIDLKGYLLGNPWTNRDDGNCAVPFAHRMGLISDELYESLKVTCKGEYQNVEPSNALCLQNLQAYYQLLKHIEPEHILEPSCPLASPRPNNLFSGGRPLFKCSIRNFKSSIFGNLLQSSVVGMGRGLLITGLTTRLSQRLSMSETGVLKSGQDATMTCHSQELLGAVYHNMQTSVLKVTDLLYTVVTMIFSYHILQLKHG